MKIEDTFDFWAIDQDVQNNPFFVDSKTYVKNFLMRLNNSHIVSMGHTVWLS